MKTLTTQFIVPSELQTLLEQSQSITIPDSRDELLAIALGGQGKDFFEVAYDVPGKGLTVEATVAKVKNGAVINYTDTYLRRRDPECMVIADAQPTDKERFSDKYGYDFKDLRDETFAWLNQQELLLLPFMAGGEELGYPMLLVAPINAGFFAGGLSDLQGFLTKSQLGETFEPKGIIYLAPTFRHTHFNGKQMVVHNRLDNLYEMFSYNLYPGPSAKKGVYGFLLNIGEKEGWTTLHGSTVSINSNYKDDVILMHEGASGGGKSEMTEQLHLDKEGFVVVATNTVTKEAIKIKLDELCKVSPVTDDMALCHPKLQTNDGKLTVTDAEHGWFLRTDHIKHYGTAPHLEDMCLHPKEPLIFLNYDAVPGGTCLIWDHIMDEPGKPCPNPRVIMPRKWIDNIVNEPVKVDTRSFGMRSPVCTKERPTYGVIGMAHILPPALAWLWRLVAPRGDNNPSITMLTNSLSSEGVGSYWPFATGTRAAQANILLQQIIDTPETTYLLLPNQHIGAYKVGFNPQWMMREYMAEQGGAHFTPDQFSEARCTLLGYQLNQLEIQGHVIPNYLLDVSLQEEVGLAGYDQGAELLVKFFKKELVQYLTPDLLPKGREIIQAFLNDAELPYLCRLIG